MPHADNTSGRSPRSPDEHDQPRLTPTDRHESWLSIVQAVICAGEVNTSKDSLALRMSRPRSCSACCHFMRSQVMRVLQCRYIQWRRQSRSVTGLRSVVSRRAQRGRPGPQVTEERFEPTRSRLGKGPATGSVRPGSNIFQAQPSPILE